MNNELTNLLPPERQRVILRNYFLRVGVVASALLIILTIVSGSLLLPTYVFLTKTASGKEVRLSTIEASLASSNEKELSSRLAALTADVGILATLGKAPSVSKILATVLAVPRTGVALSSFGYKPGVLTVSGTAASRDALRQYQSTLQSSPFALSAVLPVSAYAKDTDITFSIVITLAP